MAEVHSPDTRHSCGDTDAPRRSPATPAEDMRLILINRVPWSAVLAFGGRAGALKPTARMGLSPLPNRPLRLRRAGMHVEAGGARTTRDSQLGAPNHNRTQQWQGGGTRTASSTPVRLTLEATPCTFHVQRPSSSLPLRSAAQLWPRLPLRVSPRPAGRTAPSRAAKRP
jgi:hypothetical protein